MSERLRAIKRVQAVQAAVRDLAAWKLGAVERRQAELAAARAALEAFIAQDLPTGAFAALSSKTVRRIAMREEAAERQHALLAEATRGAETRLRLAQKMVEGLAREESDAAERRRLEELLEMFLAQGGDRPEPLA